MIERLNNGKEVSDQVIIEESNCFINVSDFRKLLTDPLTQILGIMKGLDKVGSVDDSTKLRSLRCRWFNKKYSPSCDVYQKAMMSS